MKGCKLEDGLIEINVKNEKILRKKWPRGSIKHTGIYGKSIRKQEEKGEEEKKIVVDIMTGNVPSLMENIKRQNIRKMAK